MRIELAPYAIGGYVAGFLTLSAVYGIIHRKQIAEWIREEIHYRKGSYYIWRTERRERKHGTRL